MSAPDNSSTRKKPGFGLRLRREYLPLVLQNQPDVDWFEIIPENFFGSEDNLLLQLDQLAEHYPVTLHGMSLGVGSPWPFDQDYLTRLRQLVDRLRPQWYADHICWRGAEEIQGRPLPLPYSSETLEHVVERIRQVQQALECRIMLESVPSQTATPPTEIPEAEFVTRVAQESDSLVSIDIANLHASSVSQGFDARDYLACLPADRVQQIHLAGAVILCDSQETLEDPVWELYLSALQHFGSVPTVIERLDTIASLDEMVHELERARCSASQLLAPC